jgi:hypothetical protein
VTRVLAAVGLAAVTVISLLGQPIARAEPVNCPPNCDRIPASAWVNSGAIPLDAKYHWRELAGIAVPEKEPRFWFEDACDTPPRPSDPRSYAVASKATIANSPGQWQLQAQVLHWRGDAWYGGELADEVVRSAADALRACQLTAPEASPSITTDEPGKLAAVLTVAGTPTTIVRQYVVSHPQSSTVVELALWSTSPPQDNWPAIRDGQVLDALVAPLCEAYIGSCR